MNICQIVDEIKLVYCPAHKSIRDNYTADSLTKVASKKTKHLPQSREIPVTTDITKMSKKMGIFKISQI